ncbi:MAG: hypothetical protein L7S44_07505 [Flavobacteriaceae bacterium]|nr:hypothetical protein [Flavobacteriaceae bacterium]
MIVLASLLILIYIIFIGLTLGEIYKGNSAYLLLYVICFLPFYTVFQITVFNAFENIALINSIKYSKDFVFFSSFILFIIGTKRSFINRTFNFSVLDKLIITFLALVLVYLIIPLGEANLISKIIYAKNIFLIGILYFFGRNTDFNFKNWNIVIKLLVFLTLLSFITALLETVAGTHLHSFLGYSNYNLVVNDIDPQGNYGLNWSFESQGAQPRYASFFADPLEFSASLLLFFSLALWLFIHSKYKQNKLLFFSLILVIIFSFLFAFSRASMFSGILVLVFGLYLSRNYKIIFSMFLIVLVGFVYVYNFSDEQLRFFIQDTLTFQNTSSLGHLVEWIEGIISIYENPFGVGLAMSGNASGVDQSIKIGGENQFLIYGVQMGIVSLVLYLLILIKAIYNSARLYLKSVDYNHKSIGFITSLTKFGLLIPLFTANAELYLFVALFSWYLVGQSERLYNTKL